MNAGKPSWGIAWYINGLLIPELTLQRGVEYTFTVEGGVGGPHGNNSAKLHPFYITDSPVGGYIDQLDEDKMVSEATFYYI